MRAVVLLAVLLIVAPLRANTAVVDLDGATFPAQVDVEGKALALRGAGNLRYGLLFRVYAAALYAPSEAPAPLLDPDTSRRLELAYFVDIDQQQIADFAEQHLRDQLDDAAWRRLAPRVRDWHAAFRGVRAGDRYVMQYHRGRLSLWLNDELLTQRADTELANAYFGLWLGEGAIDRALRRQLLGQG